METQTQKISKTIGNYVAEDFRTAAVFKKHQIDFCCNGHRTLEEVCLKKGLDTELIMNELEHSLHSYSDEKMDYSSWPIDLLADYIEKKHHRYVEDTIPVLKQFLEKLCRVHGERHTELLKINELFKTSAGELTKHMKKEELNLFPYVKEMVNAQRQGTILASPPFGQVQNPISVMENEHENEGQRFSQIAELTNNYQPPSDACTTFRVAYSMLEEFEKDLHLHIHLENNILFPKAIKLQEQFVN
ncbi:iron-sulfur cluster repair di-iron protein [Aegicerativicinus sediminis]|uniref:iron-sulfur cluster repair di-iron protein n=1 Tax=Aegicerativicinus sediminis TaxID=2893202 RepID=UPI001E52D875|nr:iron-sulfur cluster repair di-iron protein [Aegicerativicinus sediminis]